MALLGKNGKQSSGKEDAKTRKEDNSAAKAEARTKRYEAETKIKQDKSEIKKQNAATNNKLRTEGKPIHGVAFYDKKKGKK
ncbi:MAG: hypothetical protein LBE48_02125 [Methanomassiliicoccaceae archaeon]|nr:hypothetical protein [Methanomassiliicoccaceae archaeon]